MTTNKDQCLLCNSECLTSTNATYKKLYECKECGDFCIDQHLLPPLANLTETDLEKLKSAIYYYQMQKLSKNNKKNVYTLEPTIFTDNSYNYVGKNELLNILPKNFADRIDKTLLNLACYSKGIGGSFNFITLDNYDNKILGLCCFCEKISLEDKKQEIADMLTLLEEMGFIYIATKDRNTFKYKITAKGWLHIQELQKNNNVLPQGFIAMWFDKSMNSAREQIIKAIEDCGYSPIIIDAKEHNNQIVPEILHEIKQSKFVVADITEHRNGVYYEAGYATALKKEVIICCREDDFDSRHFDVAQKNMIKWKDEQDLYNRLIARITATVGTL